MRPRIHRLYNFAVLLIFFAILGVGWAKSQAITDWLKLRNYNPPASIVVLASQNTMTASARHVFYVNKPSLASDVASFRKACPETEQTIVLGCYHPGDNGIDIYAVKDERLKGATEVTAAHEMLHAAYERLSTSQRKQIDEQLLAYYNNNLHDQRILDTIDAYKISEPNDVVNEMHSVFATEVANLPSNLESYYKQYFSNRAVIVGFADAYKNEFTNRLSQIAAYDSRLEDLKTRIQNEESSLGTQLSQIDADRRRLDSLKAQSRFDEYNSLVATFNREVDAYNSGVSRLQSDIAEYNQMVNDRNSLSTELRGLQQSLDTRLKAQDK